MLENLQSDITKLISLYEQEKQRSNELASRLAQSEQTNSDYKKQITELNHQIDNLSLKGAFTSRGDNPEAKARIEKLVREIDKCIKLLEN